jgi:hypothetical protein
VVFSFSPDILLSPLSLPQDILHTWIDELLPATSGALRDILVQLKTRPTFAEQWPNEFEAGLRKGKARILKLESIRQDTYTLADILSQRPQVHEWYQSIHN